MMVTIFCRRPGYMRGGVRHPEFASYLPTQFSEAQLREMVADRFLTVVVGHQLTADQVADFVSKNATPEPAVVGDAAAMSVGAGEGNPAPTDAGKKTRRARA